MVKEQDNRIAYIDLFRATGIIAMVMGHINFGWHFDHLIQGFHMPMFFFVTGYFFKNSVNSSALLRKIRTRCKTLLLPYFIFAALHIVISALLNGHFEFDWLRLLIFNTDLDGLPIAGALWFLTSMFAADVIYMIIDYIFGYGIILHCIVLAIGLIGNALGIYLPFRVPFGIDASFVGLVFIHIGRVLHQGNRTERILDLNPLSSILIFTMGCSLIMINSYVNLRWGQYGIVPLFWISSVMTIVGLWNVCRLLDKRIKAKKIMHFIYNIGKDSIVYVCLNQLAILLSLRVLNKVQLPMWPRKVCVLIMTMLLLEGLRKTMIETKLKYLIGRQ